MDISFEDVDMEDINSIKNRLENALDSQQQLVYMEMLVDKFLRVLDLESLEEKILCVLFPSAKVLIEKIFAENLSIIHGNNNEENLNKLGQNLQIILHVLQIIDEVLDFISSKPSLEATSIASLPGCVAHIVQMTFLHCKQCNHIYKTFYNSLEEILKIFNAVQAVHKKLLQVLELNITFDVTNHQSRTLLIEVFNVVPEIGDVLLGMNTKSMADTLRFYTNFAEKYKQGLCNYISLEKPLEFISSEVVRCINEAKTDYQQTRNDQSIKVSKFLLKIAFKLLEIFGETTKKDAIVFFSTMYSFPELFQADSSSSETAALINKEVYETIEPVLLDIVAEGIDLKEDELVGCDRLGLLWLLAVALPKVSLKDGSTIHNLKCAFYCLEKDASISIKDLDFSKTVSLYTHLAINFAAKILSVNPAEYHLLEEFLLLELLRGSFFAFDVWTLTLSNVPPTYVYDTIVEILEIIKHKDPIECKHNVGLKFISFFLKTQFNHLPQFLKGRLFEKYSPESHINVWAIIGFENVPANKSFLINTTIQNFWKKIDAMDSGRYTNEDLMFVTAVLDIFSQLTLGDSTDANKLCECVTKLWNNINADNCELSNDSPLLFGYFLSTLCPLTAKLILKINNTQWVQILSQLRHFQKPFPSINIHICQILDALLQKQQETIIIQLAILLLKSALSDNNSITKQIIDKTHLIVWGNGSWKKYLQENYKYDEVVKGVVVNERESKEVVCRVREPNDPPVVVAKKIKVEEGQVQDVLDQMKADVKLLMKYSAQGKLSKENTVPIFDIINKLNKLV